MSRDRQTGRFVHTWDYVGVTDTAEIGRCDHCGKYRLSSSEGDRVMTRAAFVRSYPELAAKGI